MDSPDLEVGKVEVLPFDRRRNRLDSLQGDPAAEIGEWIEKLHEATAQVAALAEKVASISVLNLKPDDVVVLNTGRKMSMMEIDVLFDQAQRAFGKDRTIVVMHQDVEISVSRADAPA